MRKRIEPLVIAVREEEPHGFERNQLLALYDRMAGEIERYKQRHRLSFFWRDTVRIHGDGPAELIAILLVVVGIIAWLLFT